MRTSFGGPRFCAAMPSVNPRLSFTASGRAIDTAPLMSFGDAVAVTRNGKPFFAGTALPPRLVGQNNEENHAYTVVSPWYDARSTKVAVQRSTSRIYTYNSGAVNSRLSIMSRQPP
jgi:hypothetical protein